MSKPTAVIRNHEGHEGYTKGRKRESPRISFNSWQKRLTVCAHLGFEIPDVWVVGYGLDSADMFRTLPYIAALEREG